MSRILHAGRHLHAHVGLALSASSLIFAAAADATSLVTPIGTTSPASAISSGSATLNGTVNPNGSETTWYFQYGTENSRCYAALQTPSQSAGSGTSGTGVSAPLTGLAASTTYHYRLVASSSGGTALGADASFKTSPSTAPGVATDNATHVGATSATLNGRVYPNGHATTYYFEYGTSTSYGTRTTVENAGATRTLSVSAALSGLSAGSTYHFRVVATSSSGTTEGNDRTFITAGPPSLENGAAQSVTTSTATLTGSVNPLGRSTSWYFEYGTSPSYGTKTDVKSAGSGGSPVAVSSALASLAPGTVYHYRLVASSSAGTSLSNDLTFTTLQSVTLNASSLRTINGQFVTLSGTVSSGQVGVAVAILAQPLGATTSTTIATALTGAGGQDPVGGVRTQDPERWRRSGGGMAPGRYARRSTRDLASPTRAPRRRRDLVRRPRDPTAADGRWFLGDGEADEAELEILRNLRREPASASSALDDPHRDERERGGAGVPGRVQPDDHLPPQLVGPFGDEARGAVDDPGPTRKRRPPGCAAAGT